MFTKVDQSEMIFLNGHPVYRCYQIEDTAFSPTERGIRRGASEVQQSQTARLR